MPGAPYDAGAFAPLPGRCFRIVDQQGEAGPRHCPAPVVWRGAVADAEWAPLPGGGLREPPAPAGGLRNLRERL